MIENQPKKKKVFKVVVNRDLCIGAASCVALAPTVFDLDNEGKAVVKGLEATDEDILAGAQSCPTQAISVFDEEGNQLYP